MVLDTSAVIAIVGQESIGRSLAIKLAESQEAMIGVPTAFEASMILSRRAADAGVILDRFFRRFSVQPVSFEPQHLTIALEAFLRYGKGRHPAALNFGDCMSYAIAKLARMPLLYTGDDFAKTDIRAA